METEEKLSSENDVKENGESDKSHEEKVESAPAVKHLEENELFSTYYLVCVSMVIITLISDLYESHFSWMENIKNLITVTIFHFC